MTAPASTTTVRSRKFPTFSLLACLASVAAAVALLHAPVRERIDSLEYWTADWRTALLADRVADTHEDIVIVAFDPETFGGIDRSPIPRDVHAHVIRTLDSLEPRAIGLDFYFIGSQGPENDRIFLETVRGVQSPIVLGAVDEHDPNFSAGQLAYQRKYHAEIGKPAGYLALRYDSGHIVRRTSPPLEISPFKESFARQVALAAGTKLEGPGTSSDSMRVAWLVGPGYDTQPFLMVSARHFLPGADGARQKELAERIKGNIVLTGTHMPTFDRHDTALSALSGDKMLGVMIHAHIIAQLLDGRYFYELAGQPRLAFLAAVALVGFLLGWAVRGRRASWVNLSIATAILVGIDAASYYFLRIVLPFTLSLYVWFISVILGEHLRTLTWWIAARGRQTATA